MSRKRNKAGAPPGTLVYRGKETQPDRPVKITLFQYEEDHFSEEVYPDVESLLSAIKPGLKFWINIDGVHDTGLIEKLGHHFNIHPLTQEDLVNTDQRPKFDDYDHYCLAVLKMVRYQKTLEQEQLSIILLKEGVISFQEIEGGDAFDPVRNSLKSGKGKIRKSGPDYLCYSLIDAVVDTYFNILEKMGDIISELEVSLMGRPGRNTLNELHRQKKEMILLRKSVWPLRELISSMERSESDLISVSTDIYLRDVYDHTIRVIDSLETNRDLLSGMMDIYLSSMSNRMNEVMKVLTIISTLFIPVTFIAGVYGMNFKHMPELESRDGYFVTLGIMGIIILSLLFYFRYKKWI